MQMHAIKNSLKIAIDLSKLKEHNKKNASKTMQKGSSVY